MPISEHRHKRQRMQARQMGEQYLFCSECGQRKHPLNRLQLAHVPAQRTLHNINAVLVAVLLSLLLLWGCSYVV